MACIFLKYFKSKGAKSICIGRNLETLVGTIPEAIYSFLNVGVDIGLLKEPGLYLFFIFGTVRILIDHFLEQFFRFTAVRSRRYRDTPYTPAPTHVPCKYFNNKCH